MTELDAMVGAVLNGKWKLTKLLGYGGMGAVFAAQDLQQPRQVAIKMLHAEYVHEPRILERFIAEANTAQRLHHPNITAVFDSGQAEDGSPYLVMELLKGKSLADFLEPPRAIEVHTAAPIVYGVLQALAAAHAQGIVHRDIKPDNIFLVDDEDGRFLVKVLDFGIAKVMDVAGGMGSKTRTGVLLGTPGYMSPEQIKNSKGVDPRTDLWSTGAIFYEMLAGRSAFDAETEFAQLTAVLTQSPIPIGQVSAHLIGWQPFFDRALAREPENRFPTAQAMSEALVQASRGQSQESQISVELTQDPDPPGSHEPLAATTVFRAISPSQPAASGPVLPYSEPPSRVPYPSDGPAISARPVVAQELPSRYGDPRISVLASHTPSAAVVSTRPMEPGPRVGASTPSIPNSTAGSLVHSRSIPSPSSLPMPPGHYAQASGFAGSIGSGQAAEPERIAPTVAFLVVFALICFVLGAGLGATVMYLVILGP